MSGHERDPEARIIYAMCIVLTVPVIVIAFVRGENIGAGTSLCMLVAVLGVIGLIVDLRKRTKLPRARVVRAPAPRDPSPLLQENGSASLSLPQLRVVSDALNAGVDGTRACAQEVDRLYEQRGWKSDR
jgi:hypothetical protein